MLFSFQKYFLVVNTFREFLVAFFCLGQKECAAPVGAAFITPVLWDSGDSREIPRDH